MNQKIVFVLGAGFSREAGYPLTSDFTTKKMINLVRNSLRSKSDKKRLDKVTHYFLYRIQNNYCKNNIESVLNHVSVADYLSIESKTESSSTSYPSNEIFNDLLWYIVKTLQLKSDQIIPSEYYHFIKYIHRHQNIIISFNYDLVIETILKELDLVCDYGLKKTSSKKNQILLKIHGSVNWSYCLNCNNFIFYSNYSAERILSKRETCPECSSKLLTSIIIPPILYKDAFYKNTNYEDLVRMLWGRASEELSKASKIVFIGFSMADTDAYAQELFKLSSTLNRNENLEYLVITRPKTVIELKKFKKRFRSVLNNEYIHFKQIKFTDYARSFY